MGESDMLVGLRRRFFSVITGFFGAAEGFLGNQNGRNCCFHGCFFFVFRVYKPWQQFFWRFPVEKNSRWIREPQWADQSASRQCARLTQQTEKEPHHLSCV